MNNVAQQNFADSDSLTHDFSQLHAPTFADRQPAETAGEKYIIFNLNGQFFAVPSKKVAEVVQGVSITPLPNVPEWLLGITDLRGGIISIISLQKLLDMPSATLSAKTKFIVLKLPGSSPTVAFAVDKIGEIAILPDDEIQLTKAETMPYLLGRTMYKNNALNLIDAENLLASLTIR